MNVSTSWRKLIRFWPVLLSLLLLGAGAFAPRWINSTGLQSWFMPSDRTHVGDWRLGAAQVGPWLMAMGGLLLLLFLARLCSMTGLARAGCIAGPLLAIAVALCTAHHQATEGKTAELPGLGTQWWLDDDMMISLRYAQHCAAGRGLVWNDGERVEGISNFLWTLLLVIPHWLTSENKVSLYVIVLNSLLLVLLLAAVARLVRRLGGSALAATFCTLSLATYSGLTHWTIAGGETTLLALLLVLLASRESENGLWNGVLAGLAVLTRMDAAVAAGILLMAPTAKALLRRRAPLGLRSAHGVLAFAAMILALLLFRWSYYGTLLPNTYYLKATGWDGRSRAGMQYVLNVFSQHWLLLLAGLFSVLFPPRVRSATILTAGLAHLAYVLYVGGDELPEQRFFVPVSPLLFALGFVGIERLCRQCFTATRAPLMLPFSLLLLWGTGGALLPFTFSDAQRRRSEAESANVLLGYLLRCNTQPSARIGHFWAGASPYFSHRYAHDMFGKCDAHIARMEAKPGLTRAGHNKYDLPYSLSQNLDVIVAGRGGLAYVSPEHAAILEGDRNTYRGWVELKEDPEFVRHYLKHLVGRISGLPGKLSTISTHWHGIFVRDDTTLAPVPPNPWVAPTPETD